MSFAAVRSVIESKVWDQYQGLSTPIDVVFDNVQETPPALPYVICLISYITTTEPVICPGGGALESLFGNLQLSCYAPRARGMKALEDMAAEGMKAMNGMYEWGEATTVKCGQISGPTPVLAGTEPYALVTLSCPFNAKVGYSSGGRLKTKDVLLANPQRGNKTSAVTTKDVDLTTLAGGMKTQEDANIHFDQRLKQLEKHHDSDQGHDSGGY